MIGSNLNEWTVMGNPMANSNEELSTEELNKRLTDTYGDKAQEVLAAFKRHILMNPILRHCMWIIHLSDYRF